MQAERLDRRADRDVPANVDVIVLREQLARLLELVQLAVRLAHLVRRILFERIHHGLRARLRHILVDQAGYRVADVIQHMHCTGVDIEHKVQPVFLITMNHFSIFPPIYRNKARHGAPQSIQTFPRRNADEMESGGITAA